jgi:hypothetical protein
MMQAREAGSEEMTNRNELLLDPMWLHCWLNLRINHPNELFKAGFKQLYWVKESIQFKNLSY